MVVARWDFPELPMTNVFRRRRLPTAYKLDLLGTQATASVKEVLFTVYRTMVTMTREAFHSMIFQHYSIMGNQTGHIQWCCVWSANPLLLLLRLYQ
jgi:hypothetical protein